MFCMVFFYCVVYILLFVELVDFCVQVECVFFWNLQYGVIGVGCIFVNVGVDIGGMMVNCFVYLFVILLGVWWLVVDVVFVCVFSDVWCMLLMGGGIGYDFLLVLFVGVYEWCVLFE